MVLKAKHIVEEIDGVRCTIVEKGITAERVAFLKGLLELNHHTVMVAQEAAVEGAAPLFTLGTTDIVFNPVIAVYEMSLKTADGRKVSPAYWNQESTESIDQYWE